MFGFSSWQDFTTKAQQSLTNVSQQAATGLTKLKETTNDFIEKQKHDYQQIEHDSELKRRKDQQRKLAFEKSRPPWYYEDDNNNNNNNDKNNIESIKKELKLSILQLSNNLDNFLNEAPSSTSVFQFNLNIAMPYAKNALNNDPKLQSIRYQLVPKKIKENQFWKNYFYRVQVIRESLGVSKLNLGNIENEKIEVNIDKNDKNNDDNNNNKKEDDNENKVEKDGNNVKNNKIDDNEIKMDINNNDNKLKTEKDVNKNEINENNITDAHGFVSDEIDVDELTDKEKESIKKELGIKEDDVDDTEVNNLLTSINADGDDLSDISDGELEKALENTN